MNPGRLFTSFDEAWDFFVARSDPLESMWDQLLEAPESTVDVWLVPAAPELSAAARELQAAFAHLTWVAPLPEHFLHVALPAHADELGLPPLVLRIGRVNCFHDSVVAEVASDELRRRARDATYLPHLSLGYVREPHDAEELRRALVPLRDRELGEQLVREIELCRVPFSHETFLRPWTVVRQVPLDGQASL